ncbi:MAG: hypothetical protein ACEQSK_15945 [Sphingomonadaceae bacterium]
MIVAIFSAMLGGCMHLAPASMTPGTPEAAVRAQLGTPAHTYRDGADTLLEYPKGQTTYMVRLDARGQLASYQQVLTSAHFASVRIGHDDRQAILHAFGQPDSVQHYALSATEAWLYRYKEQEIWNSIMYVEFDAGGRVKAMLNGPDPEFERGHGR